MARIIYLRPSSNIREGLLGSANPFWQSSGIARLINWVDSGGDLVATIIQSKARAKNGGPGVAPQLVATLPSKRFFISMLTKDISLEDCILDLVDNAVDSAGVYARSRGVKGVTGELSAYEVRLSMNKHEFLIVDNCGGMTIKTAREEAFHFGLLRRDSSSATRPIGLFGIGMKRAIFKIGTDIVVRSSTGKEAFEIKIDAVKWAASQEWELKLEPLDPHTLKRGTSIEVRGLHDSVAAEFADPVFRKSLSAVIGRDYSLILRRGFRVFLNDERVKPHAFKLLEGGGLKPHLEKLDAAGVSVEVLAGMAPSPAGVDEVHDPESLDVKNAGWFVICNDRVVLAGDKSQRTGWGTPGMAAWHAQFGRFLGIAKFSAADPQKLPWTTTKRDVDPGNAAYQMALPIMRKAAKAFTAYTTKRRKDLTRAVKLEKKAHPVDVNAITETHTGEYPTFKKADKKTDTRISYDVSTADFQALAKAFKLPVKPAANVGIRSFDFAYKNLVDE